VLAGRAMTGKSVNRTAFFLLAALLGAAWAGRSAVAGQLAARAAVERQEVYVGEPFVFQIQIMGSDAPEAPDVTPIKDFDVQALGGRQNNSESVTIINGQMSRVVQRAYVFSYRLTAKQAGQFTIPSISVTADGVRLATNPVPIRAIKPTETEDAKLRLTLDKPRCYVGEPVVLTVTWYVRKDCRDFAFDLPVLSNPNFQSDDPEIQIDNPREFLKARLGHGEVIARRGTGKLDDLEYTTVTFRKVLIPKQAGNLLIPAATVACDLRVGTRRPSSPFDGFFDDDPFDRGRYKRVVVPSDTPALQVLELPAAGRPANFAGLVGACHIEASATPLEASVGDPITLTVRLSGPPYLKNVDLPPLKDQPALARDFKIPEERAEGKTEGSVKVFTQTIRALRPNVSSVPPIELAYFDTDSGTYRVAKTKPIPLVIRAAKVVTASDIEGREVGGVQTELKSRLEGIAYNYEDLGVLDRQPLGITGAFRDTLWLSLVVLPFLAYVAVVVATVRRQRSQADPAAALARRAFRDLNRELRPPEGLKPSGGRLAAGAVLQAFRNYLGKKLRLPPAALTWGDVESLLRQRGVAPETLNSVQDLFHQCEAGHYAGATTAETPADLPERARSLAKALERSLPKVPIPSGG